MSQSIKNAGRLSCLGACSTLPSWRGEGGAARCEAAGLGKPEVYSLEYIDDFFWAANVPDSCGSFAAVERSMSDRFLRRATNC